MSNAHRLSELSEYFALRSARVPFTVPVEIRYMQMISVITYNVTLLTNEEFVIRGCESIPLCKGHQLSWGLGRFIVVETTRIVRDVRVSVLVALPRPLFRGEVLDIFELLDFWEGFRVPAHVLRRRIYRMIGHLEKVIRECDVKYGATSKPFHVSCTGSDDVCAPGSAFDSKRNTSERNKHPTP